jgi:hypothetical protein
LALALGYQACLQGVKTLFTTAMNLINHLSASLADHSFLKAMKTFTSPRLLVINRYSEPIRHRLVFGPLPAFYGYILPLSSFKFHPTEG